MAIDVALDTNNTAAQNKAELVAALSSYQTRGGEIRLPRAETPFNIDPGIVWAATRNMTLVGDGVANAYEDGFGGTQLKFTSGSIGIDLSQISISDPAAPYAFIGGISFHGNGVCSQGLRLGGISHVEHVEAKNFTQANIHTTKLVNSLVLAHVSVIGGGNIGLWIGGESDEVNPNNTRISINELISRANIVGVRMEQAQGVRFSGGVIEANYHEGMVLHRPANRVLEDIVVRDVWFEANWRGELGYAITIDGAVAPKDVRFEDCGIHVGGQSKALLVTKLDGGLLSRPSGSGAIDLGSACQGLGLLDVPTGYTVTDNGTGNWQKSLSQIGSGGSIGGGSGSWPITTESTLPDQNQSLTGGQVASGFCEIFPTANRTLTMPTAVDIITAMGGYEAGATADFVIMNRTSLGGVTVALANNTGTTVKGENVIPNGSGLFAVRMDGANAVSIINKSTH